MTLTATWHDHGWEPHVAPNPEWPNGIALDASGEYARKCTVALGYPAKRCGYYEVKCDSCGMRVSLTTAGRPDDPRSLTLPCHVTHLPSIERKQPS